MSKPTLEQLKYYLDAGLIAYGASDLWKIYGATESKIVMSNGMHHQAISYEDFAVDYDLYMRPMSSLTLPITIDGEEKMPIEYIVEDILKRELNGVAELTIKEFLMNFHDLYFTKDYTDNIRFADLCAIFQFLVKHKFDVFNGIGTWAIDVNTLTENIY